MSWHLDQERITQAAAFLMKCGGEARVQYLKLLKLLYFADRCSLAEKGRPITGDKPVAMKFGPVLSTIYDYITADSWVDHSYWDQYFKTSGCDVELVSDPGTAKLSRYDRRILTEIHGAHGNMDGFDLSEASHLFPEWVKSNERRLAEGTGSAEIPIEEILKALGFDDPGIDAVRREMADERAFFRFFDEAHDAVRRKAG